MNAKQIGLTLVAVAVALFLGTAPLSAKPLPHDERIVTGKLDNGVALTGQVAGRIEAVVPVAEVVEKTVREFAETVERLAKAYAAS